MSKSILNLGAGKVNPGEFGNGNYVVHVDGCYIYSDSSVSDIAIAEEEFLSWQHIRGREIFVKSDIFDFLDSFKYKFDHINADRIFEHMFYDAGEVGRLLDACNQITTDEATMDIIVPNHLALANAIVNMEDQWNEPTDLPPSVAMSTLLEINTEMCNTRSDPHGSIWTPELAKHYIGSEGETWKIKEIIQKVKLKGRDCYMKISLNKG